MAELLTRQTKLTPLDDIARHVVRPSGIVSTGWPAVRDTCAKFGVIFDDWQIEATRLILAKRSDGTYACSIGGAVMSIPRQVGKTYMVGAIVFALCLNTPGTTVLWTAHRLRTGNETFAKMRTFADRKAIKPHVEQIFIGSGTGEIVFANGSRILFGARERGFGRGFDDVDVEVFDEAQILTDSAIDDMVPASNTAANPLLFFIGTPPKPKDPSEVFTAKRNEALSGKDEDTAYIEFSADEDASPDDQTQWAKANPSHPLRTPDTAMKRMRKNLTLESFMREALGIWGEIDADEDPKSISLATWDGLAISPDFATYDFATARMAVAASEDRGWCSITVAGINAKGFSQLKVVAGRVGTDWVATRAAELHKQLGNPEAVSIVKGDPLAAELKLAGVPVFEVGPGELATLTQKIIDATKGTAPTIRHQGEPELRKSIEIALLKPFGQAGVIWAQRATAGDISPLTASTMAFGRLGVESEKKTATAHVVFA